MKRFAVAAALLFGLGLGLAPAAAAGTPAVPAAANPWAALLPTLDTAPASTPPGIKAFSSCVAGTHDADFLLLFDTSGSLNQSDPAKAGVTARAAAAALFAREVAAAGGEQNTRISVKVASFSAAYTAAGPWHQLDAAGLSAVNHEIKAVGSDHSGFGTDYWSALTGAEQDLAAQKAADSAACQAIVWFTDGALSIASRESAADRRRFGTTEPYSGSLQITSVDRAKQATADAQKDMCRPGGLLDSLRTDSVWTFGIGLESGSDAGQFGLLQAAAEGTSPSLKTCGAITQPAPGTFVLASDIDELAKAFVDIAESGPGVTQNKGICQQTICTSQAHRFVLDASIRAVHILASSTIGNAVVTLAAPGGRPVTLTNSAASKSAPVTVPAGVVTMTYQWFGRSIAVDLQTSSRGAGWTGQWALVFTDPTGSSASGRSTSDIRITADVFPSANLTGQTLRAGSTPSISLGLVDGQGNPINPTSLLGTVSLSAALAGPTGTTLATVASGLTKTTLANPVTLDLSHAQPGAASLNLTLTLTTAAVSPAIPGTTLSPSTRTISLTIATPEAVASVVPPLTFGTLTGTKRITGQIAVVGPGCAWVDGSGATTVASGPDGIGTVQIVASAATSRATCQHLGAGEHASLPVTLSIGHEGNGALKGSVVVSLSGTNPAGRAYTVPVRFTAELRKKTNAFHFAIALISALLLGPGVPLLLLLIAKWSEARIPNRPLFSEQFPITLDGSQVLRDGAPLALRERDLSAALVDVGSSGGRDVRAGTVPLRTKIALLPARPSYVDVDTPSLIGASSDTTRPTTPATLHARLPLAVHNHWVLLHDPMGPPNVASLLLLASGDASRVDRERLVEDARQHVPDALTRLRAEAGARGLANPAAAPAGAGDPFGAPAAADSPFGQTDFGGGSQPRPGPAFSPGGQGGGYGGQPGQGGGYGPPPNQGPPSQPPNQPNPSSPWGDDPFGGGGSQGGGSPFGDPFRSGS